VGIRNLRLFPIGRLDAESEGLLLLTNDGDFAQRVAHPRFGVSKVYRVIVKGEPPAGAIEALQQGVWLAEGRTAPAKVVVLRRTRELTTLAITLHEGRNRELRRMLARVAMPVKRLLRIQVGVVRLGTLKRGEWRELAPWEVASLRRGAREDARPDGRAQPRSH